MQIRSPQRRKFGSFRNAAACVRSWAQLPPWTHHRLRIGIESTVSSRGAGAHLSNPEFSQRLRRAIVRAAQLKLDKTPRLSILDIGCGGGFFVAVAKYLGHSCTGTELPADRLSSETRESYWRYLEALGCAQDCEMLVVRPFTPLCLGRQFDLITAGLVCFDEVSSTLTWSRLEWKFFFDDIQNYLTPNGRVFIELNARAEYARLRWYTPDTLAFFKSIGDVSGNLVMVTHTNDLRPGRRSTAS